MLRKFLIPRQSRHHVILEMKQQPPEEKLAPPASDTQPTEFVYPHGFRLALIMVSIFIGMFLVALVGSNSDT